MVFFRSNVCALCALLCSCVCFCLVRMAAPRPANNKILQFKLVLLGEAAVGKSSLVLRFVKGHFQVKLLNTFVIKYFVILSGKFYTEI